MVIGEGKDPVNAIVFYLEAQGLNGLPHQLYRIPFFQGANQDGHTEVGQRLVGQTLKPLDMVQAREDYLKASFAFHHKLSQCCYHFKTLFGIMIEEIVCFVQQQEDLQLLVFPKETADLKDDLLVVFRLTGK